MLFKYFRINPADCSDLWNPYTWLKFIISKRIEVIITSKTLSPLRWLTCIIQILNRYTKVVSLIGTV